MGRWYRWPNGYRGYKKTAWTGGFSVRSEWMFVSRFADSINKVDSIQRGAAAQYAAISVHIAGSAPAKPPKHLGSSRKAAW